MGRKLQIFLAFIALIMIIACEKDPAARRAELIGTWLFQKTDTDYDWRETYTFKKDGTVLWTNTSIEKLSRKPYPGGKNGTWTVDSRYIRVHMKDFFDEDRRVRIPLSYDQDISYSLDGNKLTITEKGGDGYFKKDFFKSQ